MAYTQTDLDALDAAIKNGATSVSYSNGTSVRTVSYRSLAEMLQLRSVMQQDISGTTTTSFEARGRHTKTDKGL